MKLHPSDYVAVFAVGYDVVATAILWSVGQPLIGIVNLIVGTVIVVGVDLFEDRHKSSGKLSWVDWLQVRDLIATMHGKDAIALILHKAYGMTEDDMERLSPQELDVLMKKLKVEQAKV